MTESIEQLSTEYFDVIFTITQRESGIWSGEAVVRRKDTGEEVRGGCVRYDANKKKIEKEIYDVMKKSSSFLSTPPPDWNSNVKKILARCGSTGRRVTNFSILIDKLAQNTPSKKILTDDFFDFCNDLTSDIIWLIKNIEELSIQERTELLTSNDDVYNDALDPWNLDDLTSRSEIYKYFIKPSLNEAKAHELHNKKFNDAITKKKVSKGEY